MPDAQNPFNIDLHDDDARQINSQDADSLGDVDDKSLHQQIKSRYSQDTLYRKHLAKWVMWIVPGWLIAVVLILIFTGVKLFDLDPSVLISLLATTTVNVLGLAYIVLKGIFPQK